MSDLIVILRGNPRLKKILTVRNKQKTKRTSHSQEPGTSISHDAASRFTSQQTETAPIHLQPHCYRCTLIVNRERRKPPPTMMAKTKTIKTSTYLLVDTKSRGYGYFGTPPPFGVPAYSSNTEKCDIVIEDGRPNTQSLKLDDASFELVDCPTKLTTEEFYKIQQQGDTQLKEKYEQEVSEFVQTKLGCDKIVCFHSQVRNAQKAEGGGGGGGGVQGYAVGGPHTDSSALSGDELALRTLETQGGEEDASSYKRYLYLNFWRNISDDGPIEDYPLAMLDERTTVKPDDYLARDLYMANNYHIVQYGLNVRHSRQYKWYYFPNMTKQEGILFKQMDSDWTKTGRTCFHMAVQDPNAPADAKPRESIELRMICYWKDATVDSMPSPKKKKTAKTGEEENPSASSLQSASSIQLIGTLLTRLPLVGYVVRTAMSIPIVNTMMMIFHATFLQEYPPYTGNPDDYVSSVQRSVDGFAYWPSFAKRMVEQQLTNKSERVGSEILTKMIVDDSAGYLRTKKFPPQAKKSIVDACLGDDEYMQTVRKQVGKLFIVVADADADADADISSKEEESSSSGSGTGSKKLD